MSGASPFYRLPERRPGGVVFGLSGPQVGFAAAAVMAMVVVPASVRSSAGLVGAIGLAGTFAALGFLPVGGRRLHDALAIVGGFALRRLAGRHRWAAPLPLLTGTPEAAPRSVAGRPKDADLPACLKGIELLAVDRPHWAGVAEVMAPVGLVADRRSGALTGVLEVRGDAFSLLDPAERRHCLAGWAQVLSQFAREVSPVLRLGWTLWSAPASLAGHREWMEVRADSAVGADYGEPVARAAGAYRRLLDEAAPVVTRHDLRVWLTIDARRLRRRTDPADACLAALRALSDRCRGTGLVVEPPASPVQIAEAMRVQADPAAAATLTRIRGGLAERAGLASPLARIHAGPLAMDAAWDAVRVDGAWHRVFWICQWPTLGLDAGWLDSLLLSAPAVRTLSVVMEPVAPRISRRRINADTVTIEGQVAMRERHAFRVPVGLARAHQQVDQREAELAAGFTEYGYLALVDVAAASRDELEDACHEVVDLAAQCGITELRPLHGRHDLAFVATLPLGRVPGRPLFGARL